MKIAAYLRVSKADRKKSMISSSSIASQKNIIGQFLMNHQELSFFCSDLYYFIDDGYSGMNLDRPAFQKMLVGIVRGEYQLVIVKDFSRLSRDHLILAKCIEEIFPYYQVRVLSVSEGYDSHLICFENANRIQGVFYEYYCHDIAKKVKTSLVTRKQSGDYATAQAPYGYRLVWKEDGRRKKQILVVEPREAEEIRLIFLLFSKGERVLDIAKKIYKEEMKTAFIWRMLKNPVYIGKRVWGKYRKEQGKEVLLPVSEWKVECGKHDAIVSDLLFFLVQGRMKKTTGRKNKPRHIFHGLTKCAVCGKALCIDRHGTGWLCCRCSGVECKLILVHDLMRVLQTIPSVLESIKMKTRAKGGLCSYNKKLLHHLIAKIDISYQKEINIYVKFTIDESNSLQP